MEYQKSYKWLIIWFLLLLAGCAAVTGLSNIISGQMLTRLVLLVTALFLDLLLFIIYNTESVYWINGGPDFETAKQASSERRKAYAWKHLRNFLIATVLFAGYIVISCIYNLSSWLDILTFTAALIGAAFSTISIKF